ncbi:1003_t:CDS:2 [Paraglomus occultum]|uniref:Prefoldin subunit 4 n=1 Tax=Paraglomus occultum TaxID=144539 RepID=A0A9N8VKN6_9GLOM|nr:1003_t:CDS:2 [Paraglomus occultum]
MTTIKSPELTQLNEDEEVNAEVTWEDQQNINSFSKLVSKYNDIEEQYEHKKQEKEYIDDLALELELVDEDELVRYKIGDAFILLSLSEVQSRLEQETSLLTEEVEELRNQLDSMNDKMQQLKTILYGKFGTAINLEKD